MNVKPGDLARAFLKAVNDSLYNRIDDELKLINAATEKEASEVIAFLKEDGQVREIEIDIDTYEPGMGYDNMKINEYIPIYGANLSDDSALRFADIYVTLAARCGLTEDFKRFAPPEAKEASVNKAIAEKAPAFANLCA